MTLIEIAKIYTDLINLERVKIEDCEDCEDCRRYRECRAAELAWHR